MAEKYMRNQNGWLWFSFINLKNIKLRKVSKSGTVTHTHDPSSYMADAGELQVQGNPQLHSEILFKKSAKANPDYYW